MTKEDLLRMTYEVYPTIGGYQAVQVLSPEDLLLLPSGALNTTTETLEALLQLDLDPEEKVALEKALKVIHYFKTELTLVDLL